MRTVGNKGSVPFDTIFELLADHQRRCVLSYLKNTSDDVVSRRELASHVSTQIPDAVSEEHVAARLHHTVLPKLDGAGLLEYDPRSATVRYRAHPGVESCLDRAGDYDE